MRLSPAQFEELVSACQEGDYHPHPFEHNGEVCLAVVCVTPMRDMMDLLGAIADNASDRDEIRDWISVFEDLVVEPGGGNGDALCFFPNVTWDVQHLPEEFAREIEYVG